MKDGPELGGDVFRESYDDGGGGNCEGIRVSGMDRRPVAVTLFLPAHPGP
jgi:hypothetical protein